jgi:hypothetical protein
MGYVIVNVLGFFVGACRNIKGSQTGHLGGKPSHFIFLTLKVHIQPTNFIKNFKFLQSFTHSNL